MHKKFICSCNPNGLGSFLEKHIFHPFLAHVWLQNNTFSRQLVTLEWRKCVAKGSKWTNFTCLCTPNGLGSFLGRHNFDPFLSHFGPIFCPRRAHFQGNLGIRRTRLGHDELQMRQKHLFWHSMSSKIIFERGHLFLHPVDLIDPFWHRPLWATSCSLPHPTGPRYRRLGVRWCNLEGWKSIKSGRLRVD